MKTLLEVLNSGTEYLTKQGCPEARSVMQHLMAHVLQCNRTYLYSHFDRPLEEEVLLPLRELIKKKAQGIPLQHLLGTTEFYRREFLTDSRALVPRPETEELVEFVLKYTTGSDLRVLDMGTGSGIIGITLALELGKRLKDVTLADISRQALDLALENAMRLGVKVATIQTDLFAGIQQLPVQNPSQIPLPEQGDATAEIPHTVSEESAELTSATVSQQFDLIVANLPYIADDEALDREVTFDPSTALYGGPQGWEIIERFLTDAPVHLSPDGMVALEIGYDQGQKIEEMMRRLGYRNIAVLRDLNGIPRFPMGKRPAATDATTHT